MSKEDVAAVKAECLCDNIHIDTGALLCRLLRRQKAQHLCIAEKLDSIIEKLDSIIEKLPPVGPPKE